MADTEHNDSGKDNDEIMTLAEIARFLKVSEKTVVRMVQSGRLPGTKVARQWRFVRAAIDDWLNSRMYMLPKKDIIHVIGTSDHVIPITQLVSPGRILLDMKPGTKEEMLSQLVEPLLATKMITNSDSYLSRLIERESLVSTAIGHGLAIPHVRAPEETTIAGPCIVLGICRAGTDFDGLDGRKTYVFAMPCTHSESSHLRLLAKISLIFRKRGVMKRLKLVQSEMDVITILSETDREIESRL